jgi:prolyl 4-hydroxylase
VLLSQVYLQAGEMVLYEGARLNHGRPMRLKGKAFGNIFTHFAPMVRKRESEE